jgi:Tol biopolymer transport system component
MNLWLLPSDGRKPRLWVPSNVFQGAAKISPNGQWVAYQSNESTAGEIYIRRFPSAQGIEKISPGGGRWPQWREDEKAIFYLQGDELLEVELDLGTTARIGAPRTLFTVGENIGYAVFPKGKGFLICRPVDPVRPLTITVLLNWTAGLERK